MRIITMDLKYYTVRKFHKSLAESLGFPVHCKRDFNTSLANMMTILDKDECLVLRINNILKVMTYNVIKEILLLVKETNTYFETTNQKARVLLEIVGPNPLDL